ncbi:MAG: high frequency lysogenization protein HflD [Porticoccaceae bacterium]|nr:high frequency lysogenization protein HflD [Porticoccaceae bacterium]MDG1473593.1 high frequency lysogenization protein HflD [Porticoccaceae bacterium]
MESSRVIFSRPTSDQALSLAAVFHYAVLVDRLANTGEIPEVELANAMAVLLNQNPDSIVDLYGPSDNISLGVRSMRDMIVSQYNQHADVTRYVIGIMYLARRLYSDPERLKNIADRILNANHQAEHFSPTHDNVIANVAGVYTDVVSTMRSRIQVTGNALYLSQPAVAQRVRCLLFAGIRSAFLWQQLGGKRSHLLWQRKNLIKALPK